ncbi:hypothetical protein [Paractinoplanes atraurantiacus]|uniref:Uncharacterized protein n=1 Tax=Paractinoplanes atraurantiacus TaxID=1036182 RepID=A0A285H0D5_9ACTN|nr:hypothetical protein [Actinoplanes atraurantiacus]SNY29023.1 hypothetical protein SAMN05421748_103178 [Actinoplanes atraurantiacus]
MTNALYATAAEGFIDGSIDLDTATIKAAFVRGYTFSASHRFVSDVTGAGGTLNGTSAALASKTVTSGVFDAADTTVTTTASAVDHGILLFQSSAAAGGADVAASAQRVIAWYDTGTGLPIQPGTGSTPITWDNGTNRILKVG